MRRCALRDGQWERIKDLLPGRPGSVGVTAADNRLFVEAVLYRDRAGVPWRDLPERFGDWKNVHRRFSRWAKSAVWQGVFQHLSTDAVPFTRPPVFLPSAMYSASRKLCPSRS
jgi:transposase